MPKNLDISTTKLAEITNSNIAEGSTLNLLHIRERATYSDIMKRSAVWDKKFAQIFVNFSRIIIERYLLYYSKNT